MYHFSALRGLSILVFTTLMLIIPSIPSLPRFTRLPHTILPETQHNYSVQCSPVQFGYEYPAIFH
jgi:hypothetical protein